VEIRFNIHSRVTESHYMYNNTICIIIHIAWSVSIKGLSDVVSSGAARICDRCRDTWVHSPFGRGWCLSRLCGCVLSQLAINHFQHSGTRLSPTVRCATGLTLLLLFHGNACGAQVRYGPRQRRRAAVIRSASPPWYTMVSCRARVCDVSVLHNIRIPRRRECRVSCSWATS